MKKVKLKNEVKDR